MSGPIRVLVAEDSETARALLVSILRGHPAIDVIAEARNGEEAVRLTADHRPDLVTMDFRMPGMDGFEATRRIMAETPTPVLIVTASENPAEVEKAMRTLRIGAVGVIPKPTGPGQPGFETISREIVESIRALAGVRVVRRREFAPVVALTARGAARIVAVVASTGGPAALHRVFADLPPDFPAPILVVQHISPGFVGGLATWLDSVSPLPVRVAEDGEPLGRGVCLAGDGAHLGVRGTVAIELSVEPAIDGFRPSGTHLLRSVASAFGKSAVSVLLTGMGRDGVAGARDLRAAGGRVLAQDEATSVVYGIPAEAVREGLPDAVLPLEEIGARLIREVAP